MEDSYKLNKLKDDVYQFESFGKGSHVYLITGDRVNVLIDTGNYEKFNSFIAILMSEIGIDLKDINLVINTHEHWDHISSNHFFKYKSLVAAHRFAATKIELQDEYVIRGKECNFDVRDLKTQIWLEDKMIFDLGGDCHLKVFHTPGHTSGSICIYDPFRHFIFTGDTVFSSGYVSNIYESGSLADYINSLQIINTLRLEKFFPGHGPISNDPYNDINASILGAKIKLDQYIEGVEASNPDGKPTPSVYDRKNEK
ncbi:MAG: MBL fold metallo-hydrolase [Candidatus Helarchaeota archaeon]